MKPTKCQQALRFFIVRKATRIQTIFKTVSNYSNYLVSVFEIIDCLCDFCWSDAVLIHLQVIQNRQLAKNFTGKLSNIIVGQITEKTKP